MTKKTNQAASNPFKNTDSNKRYYTYDYYLRKTYGGKCAKITLDAGFTCPNIDGTCGTGGCIYCSARGSGDFAQSSHLSLREQYDRQREIITKKWDTERFIPYLQAHTNTYAPIDLLRRVYSEAVALPGAVALHIATRADCLPQEVLLLLREVSEQIPLTVELGLQTIFDETAELINRGHTYGDFLRGYKALRREVPKARVAMHLINGLPGEDMDMMLNSAAAVGVIGADEVKIHLLHVLKNTPLADLYKRGKYTPMTREEYIKTVAMQLTVIPSGTVIGRLTGDGAESELLAPLWSLKKTALLNDIDKYLFEHKFWQGIFVDNAQKDMENFFS